MDRSQAAEYARRGVLYLLALVLILVPLVMTNAAYVICEPIKLTVFRILSIAALGLFLLHVVLARGNARRLPLLLPWAALLLIGLAAALRGIDFHTAFYGELYRYDGWLTWANYAAVFFLAAWAPRSGHERRILTWSALVPGGLVGAYAVMQHFGMDVYTWNPRQMDLSRSFATFGNPVFMAGYLAMIVPVALGVLLASGVPRNQPKRASGEGAGELVAHAGLAFPEALILALATIGLVFSYGRAGWAGALAGLVVLGVLAWLEGRSTGRVLPFEPRVLGLAGLALLAAAALYFTPATNRAPSGYGVASRAISVLQNSEGSLGARSVLWESSLAMVKARPALGFGPDTFRLALPAYKPLDWFKRVQENTIPDKAHSDFLQAAVGAGALGLAAYLWLMIALLGLGWRACRASGLVAAGLMGALAAYVIQVQMSFSIISVTPVFWVLAGLLLSMSAPRRAGIARGEPLGTPDFVAAAAALLLVASATYTAVRPFLADIHAQSSWEYYQQAQRPSAGQQGQAGPAALYQAAADEMRGAIALNPGEVKYRTRLGEEYARGFVTSGDWATAGRSEEALADAKRMSPADKDVYLLLGNLYSEAASIAGRTDREAERPRYLALAADNYTRVTVLDRTDTDAFFSLGLTRAQQKRLPAAEAALRTSIRLAPRFEDAYLLLGRLYEQQRNRSQAKSVYMMALRNKVRSPAVLGALERVEK